jgi:nucleotide-binding universal stress UspA family protein
MSNGTDIAPIRSILHATDFTVSSELAFAHALKIALAGKTKLYLLHADPDSVEEVDWSAFPGVRRTLARWGVLPDGSPMSDVGDKLGIHLAKVSAPDRDPVRAIVRFVSDHGNDLIVLATHGREGLPRWLRGGRRTGCPRGGHPDPVPAARNARLRRPGERRRAAPHRPDPDRSPAPAARRSARGRTAVPDAVAVRHRAAPDVRREESDMPALELETATPFTVTRETRSGDVVDEILAAAAGGQADLIGMATAGHQGFLDAVRGSTTERVLRHAPCPVLAVPAD